MKPELEKLDKINTKELVWYFLMMEVVKLTLPKDWDWATAFTFDDFLGLLGECEPTYSSYQDIVISKDHADKIMSMSSISALDIIDGFKTFIEKEYPELKRDSCNMFPMINAYEDIINDMMTKEET